MNSPAFLLTLAFLSYSSRAQDAPARHNLEVGAGSVIPAGGYLTNDYSPGPAGRAAYELRFIRPLGAELGFTEAGLPGTSCSRFGCEHPWERLKFLDYGLRGHVGVAGGRLDLSAGVGGGYIWHDHPVYVTTNGALFQYSGKAALALDRRKRFRIAVTVRTWRDLGRPTQVWLSTMGSLIFGM